MLDWLKRTLIVVGIGSILAVAPGGATHAQEVDPVALNFVQETGLNANFETLLVGATSSNPKLNQLVLTHGEKTVSDVYNAEVRQTLEKYQLKWDKNLAIAYQEHYTPEELQSLLEEEEESPYFEKLKAQDQSVANRMKEMSAPLLAKAVEEVVQGVLSRFAG